MKIIVVIPAYNEAERISEVISNLRGNGYYDLVVVDDGSKDDTANRALQAGAVVLRHTVNRGMGAALQTGNNYALQRGAEIIVHFDGDGQMRAEDITGSVKVLNERQVQVVLGSRFLDGSSQLPKSKRYLLLPVARVINYFFTGLWLSDAHNGFRVLSRQAAQKIVITQDGMAHNTEITEQIKKYNLSYCEVPVRIFYHEYGQGLSEALKILRDLLIGKLIH